MNIAAGIYEVTEPIRFEPGAKLIEMGKPTQEQMCADLARAMGWVLINWSWIDPDCGRTA